MRPPSLLVPLGGVVAAIGLTRPVVTVGVQAPDSAVPLVGELVEALPDQALGASAAQQAVLVAAALLAIGAWALPRMLPRTRALAFLLAGAAAMIASVAAYRGWRIATEGPRALLTGDSSFLERNGLEVLDRLHARGVLVLHPTAGLWVLTAGAVITVLGLLLPVTRLARRGTGDG